VAESEKRKKGRAKFAEVMRFSPPEMPPEPFLDTTVDYLFAELWSRPGLGVRERRISTLTTLICLGNELALKLHLGAAMTSGDLSDTELDELILHVAHYGGWPGAAIASQVVRQLRAERAQAAKK
jgi:4-carboxymuconolactone decarboxylase